MVVRIHVFKESAEWDRPGKVVAGRPALPIKWWELRRDVIDALYLETWTIEGDDADEFDPETLRAKYAAPVVLIY